MGRDGRTDFPYGSGVMTITMRQSVTVNDEVIGWGHGKAGQHREKTLKRIKKDQ